MWERLNGEVSRASRRIDTHVHVYEFDTAVDLRHPLYTSSVVAPDGPAPVESLLADSDTSRLGRGTRLDEICRGAVGQGQDGQHGIYAAIGYVHGPVSHPEIAMAVHPTRRISDGAPWIHAHASGPRLVLACAE
jgi:hypothetical protein